MLNEGTSFNAIKRQLQTTAPTIIRWKQRFRRYGLDRTDAYSSRPKAPRTDSRSALPSSCQPRGENPAMDLRTELAASRATALGVSKDAVHRVWQQAV